MTTGYPVGTVCVVTFSRRAEVIGKIVTILSEPFVWQAWETAPDGRPMLGSEYRNGWLVQVVDHHGADRISHPVAWLRPLRDPDAELEPVEVVEETA